jgi:hypothetical protein
MTKIANPTNARHLEHNDGQDRNIARKGTVAKTCNDGVAIHPSMTNLQRGGAGVGGLAHPTATINDGGETIASSAAASPLAHAYSAKPDLKSNSPAAPPSPGMRSRINADTETLPDKVAYGKAMLDCATKN